MLKQWPNLESQAFALHLGLVLWADPLAQKPQVPVVSKASRAPVRMSCIIQQFAGSGCARCLLSLALNYAVTLHCLFRFNCYKLKWIAKLVSFFKSWRVSGSN